MTAACCGRAWPPTSRSLIPTRVRPLPLEVVHDFPTGAKRIKEPAQGIMATVVNGEVLLEDGKHTGALPGRVLRNSHYHADRS